MKEKNPFTRDISDFWDLIIFKNNELPFTIIINDSLLNSYIQKYPDDDKLGIIDYDKSIDDNEEFGINDMKTDEYIVQNLTIYTEPKSFVQNIHLPDIFK